MDVSDTETTGRIGLGDAEEGETRESRIGPVTMNTHENALYRVERFCVIHMAEMHQCVNLRTRGEIE